MTLPHVIIIASLLVSVGAGAQVRAETDPAGPRSINELAALSQVLIHHYECKADLLLSPLTSAHEESFLLQPLLKGETGLGKVILFENDRLIATANAQMLSLEWTRAGTIVAIAKTMIMDSPTRSYALIAVDPGNPAQRAGLVCNAVTFAQLKPAPIIAPAVAPVIAPGATPLSAGVLQVGAVGKSPPGIYRLDDGFDHSSCTAVAVSPDGLILTALHCLRNCLRLQGRMESASSPFIGLSELDIATRAAEPAICPNLSVDALHVSGVKVVATGQSLLQYVPEFLSYDSYFKDLQGRGLDALNEDFALLQLDAKTPECGALAQTDLKPNAPLVALGFQQQVDGTLLFQETPGFRYASTQQSAYAHVSNEPAFGAYVSQLFDHADFIYSSAPIKEGQSGGPVVNEQRDIAGLVSGHSVSWAGEGRAVSELFAVPLSHVMDKLPVDIARDLRTKNLSCHSTF